ncbi:hypothetical protein ACOI1H_13595 [Loktanella sp. DJP18]|uniref:hypothetical protein n=1 Tax=Loktanella sp. DJP18 TaxID=3409788 RepID=UPI003BB6CFBC
MDKLLALRGQANVVLEAARTAGSLTKSTHARLDVCLHEGDLQTGTSFRDLADLCVVAELRPVAPRNGDQPCTQADPRIAVHLADGVECPRCRLVAPPVEDDLCGRCDAVLRSSARRSAPEAPDTESLSRHPRRLGEVHSAMAGPGNQKLRRIREMDGRQAEYRSGQAVPVNFRVISPSPTQLTDNPIVDEWLKSRNNLNA